VTSEDLSGTLNQSLSYTYNNDFNVKSFTYAGQTFNYTYDNDNLLTGAGAFTIARNPDNGLPESVSDGGWELVGEFNLYGDIETQRTGKVGEPDATFTFARDNNGRITGKSESIDGANANFSYEYDSVGRLVKVFKDGTLVEEYRYNQNGTRSYMMNQLRGIGERQYFYTHEGHLETVEDIRYDTDTGEQIIDTTTYDYDLDGFLTLKVEGGQQTRYEYSLRGEFLRVDLSDGRVIEYVHDPLGRRIAKKVDGTMGIEGTE
jgi:hypothetical protein